MSSDKVTLDINFFKHLVECVEAQRKCLAEPLGVRQNWQSKINMTVIQCKDIIAEKERENQEEVIEQYYHEDEQYLIPSLVDLEEFIGVHSVYLEPDDQD